jgi:hypothetical protein
MKTIIKSNQTGKEFEVFQNGNIFYFIANNEKIRVSFMECNGSPIISVGKNQFSLIGNIENSIFANSFQWKNRNIKIVDLPNGNKIAGYSDSKALAEMGIES